MANPRKIFSRIYDQYVDKIYRFIFLKVNSQEKAEDLTSETFLRGWEAFKNQIAKNKNQKEIENPQAFLYKIARNLVIDYYREKGKAQIVSAEYTQIVDPRTNLEERVALNSDLDQIKKAIAKLNDDYQTVIIWHYLDDLPVSKIAKTLDKSEAAIRVMLHRALKKIREEIQNGQEKLD